MNRTCGVAIRPLGHVSVQLSAVESRGAQVDSMGEVSYRELSYEAMSSTKSSDSQKGLERQWGEMKASNAGGRSSVDVGNLSLSMAGAKQILK